jgi:hypothetical protein
MTPSELVKAAIERGASIKTEGGRLLVKPSEVLPANLREQIRTRKAEVIAFLENAYFDQALDDAVSESNRAGVQVMDLSKESRRRSDRHEAELTEAANRGDREAFDKALSAWRRCFALPSPSVDHERTITAYSETLERRIVIAWTGQCPQQILVDGLPFDSGEIASMRKATGSELEKILMIKKYFGVKGD